ncbi:MAG: glutamate-5-semialdehyde dehydrogenase [Deltaproteobacteria bacterium]|nr:glutamate-5-semialdehyde dehydrogenase [Deltaproteobacteria bacterium]
MELGERVRALTRRARDSSRALAAAGSAQKNLALEAIAASLEAHSARLVEANARDLERARAAGTSAAMLDRLTLDAKRVRDIAAAVREVVALPDPVGEVTGMWRRPNGILVGRMRIPLGVIGIVYEARPNVTIDAAVLCFKAGNAVVLKGGSDAIESNLALAEVAREAIAAAGLPADVVQLLPFTDRAAVQHLLEAEDDIDVIIPRGGEALIRFVAQHSRIPVIKHYKGVCHVFVDASADVTMARDIVINGKVQRPSVCNSVETVLVHSECAPTMVPVLTAALVAQGVEVRGCPRTRALAPEVRAATEADWPAEFLDLVVAMKVVDGLDDAMAHIERYGSMHTESIVTKDYASAQRFLREVGSSCVMVNASTRFADGNQLGLGAEIGISTTKLHAFGPMGLEELTTRKFIVYGEGQIRG